MPHVHNPFIHQVDSNENQRAAKKEKRLQNVYVVSDVMRGSSEKDKEIISYHHFDEVHRRKNDKDEREINQYSDPPVIGRKQK